MDVNQAVTNLRKERLDDPPTLDELVFLVSRYRQEGNMEAAEEVDQYIHEHHMPPKVVGHIRRVVRG